MQLQSALINDHENAFLVVAVPRPILDDRAKAEQAIKFLRSRGAGLPVVLVTCDLGGALTAYYGRGDLAHPPAAPAIVGDDLEQHVARIAARAAKN